MTKKSHSNISESEALASLQDPQVKYRFGVFSDTLQMYMAAFSLTMSASTSFTSHQWRASSMSAPSKAPSSLSRQNMEYTLIVATRPSYSGVCNRLANLACLTASSSPNRISYRSRSKIKPSSAKMYNSRQSAFTSSTSASIARLRRKHSPLLDSGYRKPGEPASALPC